MSAIWLPKGWLWGTKGVTFGTLGEPWWPHGAKMHPWKGENSEIDDRSTVLTHFTVGSPGGRTGTISNQGMAECWTASASRAAKQLIYWPLGTKP